MTPKSTMIHKTILSALTSSIKWNWCKALTGFPSSCRDEKLTICRAKKASCRGEKCKDNTHVKNPISQDSCFSHLNA
jgi:hypothetical protein